MQLHWRGSVLSAGQKLRNGLDGWSKSSVGADHLADVRNTIAFRTYFPRQLDAQTTFSPHEWQPASRRHPASPHFDNSSALQTSDRKPVALKGPPVRSAWF